jgi:hypothetical protein
MTIYSCKESSENTNVKKLYFDINSYFDKQEALLIKTGISIEKEITKDGKTETKNLEHVNWNTELKQFRACDINKPGWKASYQIETLQVNNQQVLQYTAIEPKLSVRILRITMQDTTVSNIHIVTEKKNSYFYTGLILDFVPNEGYSIHGKQHVLLADSIKYSIETKFVKK